MTAAYILTEPDDDWCRAIVRTSDDVELGSDGWQQMGVVEDATFTRDLAWVLVELNRLADELAAANRILQAVADDCGEDYIDAVVDELGT